MLIGQSDPCRNIYDVWFCSSLQSIDLCARSLYEQTIWFKNIVEIIFDEKEEKMRKYTANIMENFIKIIKLYKTSRHYTSDARYNFIYNIRILPVKNDEVIYWSAKHGCFGSDLSNILTIKSFLVQPTVKIT